MTVASGVGYIVLAMIAARVIFLTMFEGDRDALFGFETFPLVAGVLWPLTLLCLGVWGVYRLVTMPPRAVRLTARRDRLANEIARLESELDIDA